MGLKRVNFSKNNIASTVGVLNKSAMRRQTVCKLIIATFVKIVALMVLLKTTLISVTVNAKIHGSAVNLSNSLLQKLKSLCCFVIDFFCIIILGKNINITGY